VQQFQSLAEQFSALYSSLFDADPSTLEYVSLYPYVSGLVCVMVAWGLGTVLV
jgi:hypothetical protein